MVPSISICQTVGVTGSQELVPPSTVNNQVKSQVVVRQHHFNESVEVALGFRLLENQSDSVRKEAHD